MRAVHIIGRMNVGGPAAMVTELVSHLDADVHLLVGDVDPGEADFLLLRAPSVDVIRVRGLGRAVRPTDDVRALAGLVGQLRRLRPDIVHTHTAKAGVLGRAAAVVVGVRSRVHSFHGHLLHGYFSPAMTRSIVGAERTLATVTDRMVAVGTRVRDELLEARIGRPDQYVVIPPGVSLPAPTPDRTRARAVLGLPTDGTIVAYVARLTPVKRPDRMIAVAREVPEATFVVAGDGPLGDGLRESAPPNVRFLGWRTDMENVYASADLVLLTSDNEGMPVTLIEAAQCGVPAVVTDVGSTAEVVVNGRTGLTVAADVPRLVDALRGLLSDESRRREMGRRARDRAEEVFSVERMTAAHMTLYESLMAGPPSRRWPPHPRRRH
ncbi:MAG TPA: glycosyltransferase [Acidimicrobiales bacterium]|nr:glycosyltransferase [Acidimicrobiales bacterium]